jgi:hypothetical protein
MKYFYDTEFIEDGKTIDLISIAIVAEDGREYYAVNANLPEKRVRKHEWLMENVVPHLPQGHGDWKNHMPKRWLFDYSDHRVKARKTIRREVREFLLAGGQPELWAWFSAYDHVVLAQLFGTMMDIPEGIPMFTNDVRSLVDWTGVYQLPAQVGTAHDALDDARHVKAMYQHIIQTKVEQIG